MPIIVGMLGDGTAIILILGSGIERSPGEGSADDGLGALIPDWSPNRGFSSIDWTWRRWRDCAEHGTTPDRAARALAAVARHVGGQGVAGV